MSTNWWMSGTFHIRSILKSYIDAYNSTVSKKLPGFVHVKVAGLLKKSGLFSSTILPSDDQIIEAFKTYITLHEDIKVEPIADEVEVNPISTRIDKLLSDLRDDEEIVIYRRNRSSCCCSWW